MNQVSNEKNSLDEIDKLQDVFQKTICKIELAHDEREYDLSKDYYPNHACIWNKPNRIGEKCKILTKNSQIAVVKFKDTTKFELENIYRLEDLSLHKT